MLLVCHMILQVHVINGSCDYMDSSLSRKVPKPIILVTLGTLILGI